MYGKYYLLKRVYYEQRATILMRRFSKTICFVVLCCFAWTASAGVFCCYKTTDSTSQTNVNTSIDMIDSEGMGMNCHSKMSPEQEVSTSSTIFQMDDCSDMSACGSPNLATSPNILTTVAIAHQSSQHPLTDQFFSNTATPPTPPPKQS